MGSGITYNINKELFNTEPLTNKINKIIQNGLEDMLEEFLFKYRLFEENYNAVLNLPAFKYNIGTYNILESQKEKHIKSATFKDPNPKPNCFKEIDLTMVPKLNKYVKLANNINIMTDFVISKTNNSNKQILVYLYDAISSSDINIKKLFPHNMLLFTLLPNEEIYAKSTIIKGIGNTHAKFAAGRISTKFKTENDTVESLLPETNIDKMNYIKNEIDESPKAFL